ncbi:MAG: Na/Pi cotransporter family protein, partial [Bacteroidales bacterium]|nr:Na/Pi cotransporter family protein [Bacteroidales bacterium]
MGIIFNILTLLGSLGLFLYGMTLMSEALQKVAGDKLRNILAAMTSNSFSRIITGLFITAVIQSSSATTVMVVSFVNAGLLSLVQSIGVIMGANIGTTMTAWLISLLGFKADISILAIPLIAFGFAFMMFKSNKKKSIGELIIGFSLLFLGLSFLKDSVPDLQNSPEVLAFLQKWTNFGFGSTLMFVFIGTILTIVLQSSSATMALTLVMCNNGWIPFEMGAAMVLGENIGTTITANIAASVANVSARRAAMAHSVFNLFGVIWVLVLFKPFLILVSKIIMAMGLDNPLVAGASSNSTLYAISMVHTLFNVCNALILVWFTNQIAQLVTKIIKGKKEEEVFRLQYIHGGLLNTA